MEKMPKNTIYTCEPCGYSCGNRKSSYDKHLASKAYLCRLPVAQPDTRLQELEKLLLEKDTKIEMLTMQLQLKDEMISILRQVTGGGSQIVNVPSLRYQLRLLLYNPRNHLVRTIF